jgi:hypothetical protein
MPIVQSGDRPPHLIVPDEVADWLLDSVNGRVTYHRTSVQAAHDIVRRGVDISRSRIGSYGQGFYTATESDPFYGVAELPQAIRLVHPLTGGPDEVAAVVDSIADRLGPGGRLITPPVAAAIRRELRSLGYDGIIVSDGGGDGIDYVIALESRAVKVVQP